MNICYVLNFEFYFVKTKAIILQDHKKIKRKEGRKKGRERREGGGEVGREGEREGGS